MAVQQRLFDHYNPMEKRLGRAFFDDLPTDSGIYKMYDASKNLLYVGKAKNLRTRLFTYRRAKMETTSSKIIRLIRMTHQIEIEICSSEKEALLLENQLIREHQPEFNHAKKQPETYYYIGLQPSERTLEFSLQMHVPDKELVYGAFKGHRVVRKSMGGVIRILYILDNEVDSVFDLPPVLTQKLTPMKYELSVENADMNQIMELISSFLIGQNQELIDWLVARCEEDNLLESFSGSMILDDLDAMRWFYKRCSHRNYQINQQLNRNEVLIPQEELDDLLVEWVFARKEE